MLSAIEPNVALALGIVGVVVVGLLGIHSLLLVETIRQIADIRHHMDIDDRPRSYSLGQTAGQRLDQVVPRELTERFPVLHRLFDVRGLLVFLSSDCTTCRSVAEGLTEVVERYRLDMPILTVADAPLDERRETFLELTGLDRKEVIEDSGDIAYAVGVNVRPTVLTLRDGRLTDAATVTTATQVARIAQALVDEPSDHESVPEASVGAGYRSV